MLSREVARRFNSFEPDRMQSKPFVGIQNADTMQKYSTVWSHPVLFLLRIQQSDSESLAEYLLYPDDDLQSLVDDVTESIKKVMTVNVDDASVEDCIRDSDDQAPGIRLHAKALVNAIDRLSVYLVRHASKIRSHWPSSI